MLEILRDLPHIVPQVAGHLFDDHRPMRFAAERQQRLLDAFAEGLLGPGGWPDLGRVGGGFGMLLHGRVEYVAQGFIAELRRAAKVEISPSHPPLAPPQPAPMATAVRKTIIEAR